MNKYSSSWQMLLSLALGCTIGVATLSAQDNQPTEIVASLPDEGQPPAPSDEATANQTKADVSTNDTIAREATVVAAEPAVVAVTKDVPPAEVVTTEQVEQIADKPAEPAEVRELSIEPVTETRPMLPADRPSWVGAPNDTSDRVHRLYVASFTAGTAAEVEADEMLDDPLVAAVQRYLDETLFPGDDALPLPITPDFVRQNLLDKSTSYVAAMTTQSGTEYQKWVVLRITPEHREYFTQLLREHKQRQHMAVLGSVLVCLLGFTGLLNLAFNRRSRRYPSAVTPVSMAIMPNQGMGGGDNFVQRVAVGAAPAVAVKAAPKKRSFVKKAFILMVAAGLVFALVAPALTIVKLKHHPVRTERVRVDVDGKVFEHTKIVPLIEEALSEHH